MDPAADPRTGLVTIDPGECWQLLASNQVGRLAVNIAGRPDVFPINYALDGETIVFRTEGGTKLAGALLGSGVAFEVDEIDVAARTGWSVVVHGEAQEIGDVEGLLDAEDLPLDVWSPATKSRWVRIVPSEISGRRLA
ncbi:MAG: pyridoxamine 5'-phosphate oxidase family protein [Actinomycetota bacterium]|nr:pyridoxamine 5'-phosphate oxidase family protein [Actinomycetota bacterium]